MRELRLQVVLKVMVDSVGRGSVGKDVLACVFVHAGVHVGRQIFNCVSVN